MGSSKPSPTKNGVIRSGHDIEQVGPDLSHASPIGGRYHDNPPPELTKATERSGDMEKARPKDTGRTGA